MTLAHHNLRTDSRIFPFPQSSLLLRISYYKTPNLLFICSTVNHFLLKINKHELSPLTLPCSSTSSAVYSPWTRVLSPQLPSSPRPISCGSPHTEWHSSHTTAFYNQPLQKFCVALLQDSAHTSSQPTHVLKHL